MKKPNRKIIQARVLPYIAEALHEFAEKESKIVFKSKNTIIEEALYMYLKKKGAVK